MEDLGSMLRLKKLSVISLSALLVLSACSNSESEDMEPTKALPDTPVAMESLSELDDTEEYEVHGVSLQVPRQLEVMQETIGGKDVGDVTQVSFALPDAERASIILTVENIPEADIKNAEFSALALENALVTNGIGSEIEKSVLNWPELGQGAAVSAMLNVPVDGADVERESLTSIIAHEDLLVSISIETDPGELEDSQELRAMRTLRIE